MSETSLIVCLVALGVTVLTLTVLLLRARQELQRVRLTLTHLEAEQRLCATSTTTINLQDLFTTHESDAQESLTDTADIPENPSPLFAHDDLLTTRDGLWDWDRSTDELHFNPRFLGMLGYDPNAFPQSQDTWRDLLHPDDRESAQVRQQRMLESPEYGDSFEHIFRLRAADGSYRWFLGQILNVRRDCDGRALRVVGANVDITELKRLRDKVQDGDSNAKKTLSNATPDATWEWSVPDDGPLDAACLFTMLGESNEEASMGFSDWCQHIHPDDRDLAVALQVRIMNSTGNGDCAECTYRYRVYGSSYRWMLGRTSVVVRAADGRARRVVGVHTDVTELKALHSELEVRSERLNYAFAAARDGLWDWDVESNDVYYSPRYLTMMGYTPETFPYTQASWENTVHPSDRKIVFAKQAAYMESPTRGDSFENTYRFRAADGSYRWIMARALVVRRNATGRGMRLVGLHTDVTEMRRTQESLRILLQHDNLTGLYSRAHFEARMLALANGCQDPVSLIICDVDGLKLINDNMGHAEGDRLLVNAAGVLTSCVRAGDVVARIGGDEIAVLLPACPETSAKVILEKLQAAIATHNENTVHPHVHISMGLATAHLQNTESEFLFQSADKEMLRNKYATHTETHTLILQWLEQHLGRSVDAGPDPRCC